MRRPSESARWNRLLPRRHTDGHDEPADRRQKNPAPDPALMSCVGVDAPRHAEQPDQMHKKVEVEADGNDQKAGIDNL